MLQDATRRWRSSKATKQTWTRRCKTFKCWCCLKTKVTKRDLVVASTWDVVSSTRYYPRRPCAPSFVKSRMLPHYKHISYLFNKYSLSLYVYTRGLLGCLRGKKPCGGNNSLHLARKYSSIFVCSVPRIEHNCSFSRLWAKCQDDQSREGYCDVVRARCVSFVVQGCLLSQSSFRICNYEFVENLKIF